MERANATICRCFVRARRDQMTEDQLQLVPARMVNEYVYCPRLAYLEWVQYSVFQCLLSRKRHVELIAELDDAIEHGEDHIPCFELSPAGRPSPKITSLGESYEPVERKPIIV